MMRDMLRLLLIWILMISVWMGVYQIVCGQDVVLQLDGDYVKYTGPTNKAGRPIVAIDDFRKLPHDYAKKLPAELYYWWALHHNSRQEVRASSIVPGVVQIREEASVIPSPSNLRYRNRFGIAGTDIGRGPENNINVQRTTTIRSFAPPKTGNGSVFIYNPYHR